VPAGHAPKLGRIVLGDEEGSHRVPAAA
jgi:hypothetical protein